MKVFVVHMGIASTCRVATTASVKMAITIMKTLEDVKVCYQSVPKCTRIVLIVL